MLRNGYSESNTPVNKCIYTVQKVLETNILKDTATRLYIIILAYENGQNLNAWLSNHVNLLQIMGQLIIRLAYY